MTAFTGVWPRVRADDFLAVGEHESGIESSYAVAAIPTGGGHFASILPIGFALRIPPRSPSQKRDVRGCGFDLRATQADAGMCTIPGRQRPYRELDSNE